MKEISAKGIKGFLLYDAIAKNHFFRVYERSVAEPNKVEFKDYKICAEDIEVEILSTGISFYEESEKLDWASKIIGYFRK